MSIFSATILAIAICVQSVVPAENLERVAALIRDNKTAEAERQLGLIMRRSPNSSGVAGEDAACCSPPPLRRSSQSSMNYRPTESIRQMAAQSAFSGCGTVAAGPGWGPFLAAMLIADDAPQAVSVKLIDVPGGIVVGSSDKHGAQPASRLLTDIRALCVRSSVEK